MARSGLTTWASGTTTNQQEPQVPLFYNPGPPTERRANFADWRRDPNETFADVWERAGSMPPPTPAERRTFEAIHAAFQTLGQIFELDEHGRPFPADEVDDPGFWPRTPELVADALARVDQAAEELRRERHPNSARVQNLPARPAIATAAKCSPRARESRPSRSRRTARTAAASSSAAGDSDPDPPPAVAPAARQRAARPDSPPPLTAGGQR